MLVSLVFWASISDTFHTLPCHTSMPSYCPQPMAVAVFPNRLSCSTWSFIMAARGATMMIIEIDTPNFPLITFIIYVMSWKIKLSPKPVGRIAKTSIRKRDSWSKFRSSRKVSTGRKCSIAVIIASMSAWFDNRCFSSSMYPIPHQRHQCSSVNRKCHNRPIRGYTGIRRSPALAPFSPRFFPSFPPRTI